MKKARKPKKPKTQVEPEIQEISVDNLLFDPQNPRLASDATTASQENLLTLLWTEMAVDEVALSIAANGFFREEPLIVMPNSQHEGQFIVLEGNRRLAAVKLLRDEGLRKKLRATDIPSLSDEQRKALDRLPVSVYPSREAIWQYYGFRHINGPKPWDPFSKAQFVADVHEKQKLSLDTIADSIGDRHRTVQRLYRGFVVLRQAEQIGVFNKEDRVKNRFNFNYLYTALDQPDYLRFLGIDPKEDLRPDPVSDSHREQLKEFLIWLYGSKADKREPLIKHQSDDLRMLREVLAKPQALSVLRKSQSLDRAYLVSIGDKRRFLDATTAAKEALLQANGTVTTGYSGEDDLFKLMSEIVEISEGILEEMLKKKDSLSGKK
jgi:hypothetical protein